MHQQDGGRVTFASVGERSIVQRFLPPVWLGPTENGGVARVSSEFKKEDVRKTRGFVTSVVLTQWVLLLVGLDVIKSESLQRLADQSELRGFLRSAIDIPLVDEYPFN